MVSEDMEATRPVNAKEGARSVFKVLNHHVDRGQVENVRQALPEEVRALWPEHS